MFDKIICFLVGHREKVYTRTMKNGKEAYGIWCTRCWKEIQGWKLNTKIVIKLDK